VLLQELVNTSAAVARVAGRKAKIQHLAALLRQAPAAEVPVAVAFLSGELIQRQIGVGYAALVGLAADLPGDAGTAADAAPLTLSEVDAAFAGIGALAGSGSQAQRRSLLASLMRRAGPAEQDFLRRLLAGDLSQGALEGVMTEAVAVAAGVPADDVRAAVQVGGSLPLVAGAALRAAGGRGEAGAAGVAARSAGDGDGSAGDGSRPAGDGTSPGGPARDAAARVLAALREFRLRVGRPARPMLAAAAPSLDAALDRIRPATIEWKIDGIRIQVHRDGDQVRIFSRTLDDVTERMAEIADIVRGLPVRAAVLDGEAIALYPDGRPRPFQVTSARAASQPGSAEAQIPLTVFLFDLLHCDGEDLMDAPAAERFDRLAAIAPPGLLVPRLVTADDEAAAEFFRAAIAAGHEGVVVKSPRAPYRAGRRGSEWIKVKPRHTLDLVILAAEWGHGRRTGLLSNLHLGARDPGTGGFVMLGKTFKGLTDQMLAWQTARLLELAGGTSGAREAPPVPYGVVRVRPELVAEIAFDTVQASRRYPGGVTLRFARVLRYRTDKPAEEADTIDAVRALWQHPGPAEHPGPGEHPGPAEHPEARTP
jgi:ATP-dependent DNA ligase